MPERQSSIPVPTVRIGIARYRPTIPRDAVSLSEQKSTMSIEDSAAKGSEGIQGGADGQRPSPWRTLRVGVGPELFEKTCHRDHRDPVAVGFACLAGPGRDISGHENLAGLFGH